MAKITILLISLAIAATLQPPQVIAMIILLQIRQKTAKGLAYIADMTTFRLALGAATHGRRSDGTGYCGGGGQLT